MNTAKRYDHIIIGSGIGGMTAAAMLAKKKKKVLVLERYSIIGGCAQFFERKGYKFDVSLHQIGSVHRGFNKQMLVESGVYDRLNFIKLKDLYTSHFTNNSTKIQLPNGDIKALRKAFLGAFPQEKKGIDTWIWWMRFGGKQLQFFDNRFKNIVRRVLSEFFAPLIAPFLLFSDRMKYSYSLRHVKDSTLYSILNQLWGYYGLPAAQSNMQFNALANYGFYFNGGYYVEGGGYQICDEMRKVVEENGGTVMVNAPVKKIHVHKDKVVGVQTVNKENYFAPHVLSNASPQVTYAMLREKTEASEILKKLRSHQNSMSCSVLYLGLKKPIGEIQPALKDTYEIFINNSDVHEDQQYKSSVEDSTHYDDYIDKTTSVITIHSNVDPQSNPGRSVLNVFVPDNYKRWNKLKTEEYKYKKEALARQMIEVVKRYIPEVEKYIEVQEMATPITVQRYTNNPDGSIYGFSQTVKQSGLKRTHPFSSPFKNLHFCSAWGFPGGGYEGSMRGAAYVVKAITTPKFLYYLTWVVWLSLFIAANVLPNL